MLVCVVGFLMAGFSYKAFISYSHEDEHWARWLQRALETYRVPKRLVGEQGNYGNIPPRLAPVFRDRVDLSPGADLTESVRHELAAAETMVVICSPSAAQSRWVNEEIMAFRAMGRADRIYALIVDGDPQTTDPAEQCFPKALTENEDGELLEPLAADARKWADGKLLAKLKLVAGILGARLDEIRQREMHRRRRNGILSGVTVTAVVLLTTILSVTAISNRKVAEQRRANTEELVSFMLGTLEEISPVSGLDVLDNDQYEMVRLAEQLGFHTLDDATLLEKALTWREEGMAARDRLDDETAMSAFSNSLAALVHLYQRDKSNDDYLFEVGQAEFWVGYVHMDNGEIDQAEASMTRYGVVARRLINADPKNANNVMELSYTLMNLAVIEMERTEGDKGKAIRSAQAALEYNQLAIVLEPNNQQYISDMVGTFAWLADAWFGVCNLDKSKQFREENVELARQMLRQKLGDLELKVDLARALSGLAAVHIALGLADLAIDGFLASAELLADLDKQQPDNPGYGWESLARLDWIGQVLIDAGRIEEGKDYILDSANLMVEEQKQTNDLRLWHKLLLAQSIVSQSQLAKEEGRETDAKEFNRDAVRVLSDLLGESPDNASIQNELSLALFDYWELNDESPPADWQAFVINHSLSDPPVTGCQQSNLAARQAVMLEDLITARFYTDYLLGKGYKSASFINFCQNYGLCN